MLDFNCLRVLIFVLVFASPVPLPVKATLFFFPLLSVCAPNLLVLLLIMVLGVLGFGGNWI